MHQRSWLRLALAGVVALGLGGAAHAQGKTTVEFNRDIRPILSDNCFACHGPDEGQRKADLRLDTEKGAFADERILVPGKPQESELFGRVSRGHGEKGVMPPAKTGKKLSAGQVETVRLWIEQGAKWQKHWSLLSPNRPAVPRVGTTQADHPIDAFVRARLEREGLKASPEADRRTLLRRLSFDLIGLPPTAEEIDAFLADKSPKAYEKVVDRLLGSRHYGERMAIYWLDVVRFADTIGYHSDTHREISPYRDYVIDAFNDNKRFDRFVTEQLAGDLLPGATSEQKIASGFNRLLMTTEEGGSQAKEYMAKYASDRVRNTGTILLGLTTGCAECHDHKFDPITQRDFYSFAAFFADIQETPVGKQQSVRLPTTGQQKEIAALDTELTALRADLEKPRPELEAAQKQWEKEMRDKLVSGQLDWVVLKPEKLASSGGATLEVQQDLSVLSSGKNPPKDHYTVTLTTDRATITGLRLEALTHPSFGNGSLARGNGNFVLTQFEVLVGAKGQEKPVKIASALADFEQPNFAIAGTLDTDPKTGWAVLGHEKREDRAAVFVFAEPITGGPGTVLTVRMKHESQFPQHNIGRFRLALTTIAKPTLSTKGGLPGDVMQALGVEAEKRTDAQKAMLRRHFLAGAAQLEPQRKQIAALEAKKAEILKAAPETLISTSGTPRMTRILKRGNWLDESGEVVQPNTPTSLPPMKIEGKQANRIDLARWMTASDNPLVSRVFVNRLWKLFHGQGLVKTLDDFGSQGTWPTHPELLDWLAVEFRESGWNVKAMVKRMVMSETYRQSSLTSEKLKQSDPYNLLLARQARYRLDAEMVRDNALAISGLLSRKIGGRSVKPYQPPGYWAMLNFPKREWQNDQGEELYRRGLYTYWCRTFPHPSLIAFDAPSREECTVDRPRSNTPLQALVLLNDPIYVESARAFAERIVREGGNEAKDRVQFALRQALGRKPEALEARVLMDLYQKHRIEYEGDKAAAQAVLTVGEKPSPKDLDAVELAAWTSVARVVLNLHETITRN